MHRNKEAYAATKTMQELLLNYECVRVKFEVKNVVANEKHKYRKNK